MLQEAAVVTEKGLAAARRCLARLGESGIYFIFLSGGGDFFTQITGEPFPGEVVLANRSFPGGSIERTILSLENHPRGNQGPSSPFKYASQPIHIFGKKIQNFCHVKRTATKFPMFKN